MSCPLNVIITGVSGRMGQELLKLITLSPHCFRLVAGLTRSAADKASTASPLSQFPAEATLTDRLDSVISQADAIIDFSHPDVAVDYAASAAAYNKIFITGTTGWSRTDEERLMDYAQDCVMVKSGNMSLGVNLLAEIVEQVAKRLAPEDFDIEILEMHHRNKIDSPSGTALLLGGAAAAGRGVALEESQVRNRDGHTGARPTGAIGFASLRGGQEPGMHQVIFAGLSESLSFTHHAHSRSIFAAGALKAGLWARDKAYGLYSMRDVLNN